MTADEQARAQWVADNNARQQEKQQQQYLPYNGREIKELDAL